MENKHFSQLQALISAQEELQPSPVVKQRIMAGIHQPAQSWLDSAMQWAMGAVVAMLVTLVLWITVQPGEVLEWQSSQEITIFRIYRAPMGDSNYELLHEIEAKKEVGHYTFLDPLVIPGQYYQYRVEGLQGEGQLAFRETISGNTAQVLPAQLAIILTSLVLTFGILSFTSQNRANPAHPLFTFSTL